MTTKNSRGNINGPFGQSGSLQYREVTGPTYTIGEVDAGLSLRVTGACVITLPTGAGTPQAGYFCDVVQTGAGAVSFVAGAGATVLSSAGGTPAIASQYQGCTIDVEENGDWLVIGALV